MIRITVDLVSARGRQYDRNLGVMDIWNDGSLSNGSGNSPRGSYNGRIYRKGSAKVIREGRVENWPRKARPVWLLLLEMLRACYKK